MGPCIQDIPPYTEIIKDISKKRNKLLFVPFWWGKVDSNHRRHCQQIYSLSPLATREFPHINLELVAGLEPPTC